MKRKLLALALVGAASLAVTVTVKHGQDIKQAAQVLHAAVKRPADVWW